MVRAGFGLMRVESDFAELPMPQILDRIDTRELTLGDETVVVPLGLHSLCVAPDVLRRFEGFDIR